MYIQNIKQVNYSAGTSFSSSPVLGMFRDSSGKNLYQGLEFGYNNNTFVKKFIAKSLLKYYQWINRYSRGSNQAFEKIISRKDVPFKDLLLYIDSGCLSFQELLHKTCLAEINREYRKALLQKMIKFDIDTFNLNNYIFPEFKDILPFKKYSKSLEQKLYDDFPLLPRDEDEYCKFIEELVSSIGIKTEKLNPERLEKFSAVLTGLTNSLTRFSDSEFARKDVLKIDNVKEMLDFIPELKQTVGRKQHGAHVFDVFKHSLKVLKKIAEDSNFKKLNDSDKKVMILAALMHDITKKEGVTDDNHPFDSSLEAFFISKRFNLSEDEEIKLYKLIRNHEWLKYVNVKSKELRNNRINSIAWEHVKGNLFDMALIFTRADLKSVQADNRFYNRYGTAADTYAKSIKKKINELQETQPFIPMTKFPTGSRIKQTVKKIYPDGSTDIKGVYIDKDGLVIIKFNETEDWGKIGFPAGSFAKGVKIPAPVCEGAVETGNIKFLAHGLNYKNQLARFCAFRLPDSDALLSVSYAERPETKFRFFRPQGLLGTTDTFNIIGGGVYDTGSGYKKSLKRFRFLFRNPKSRKERTYVSDMIKKASGMDDSQYRKFVLENQNKPYTEIYPEEFRNKMIEALGGMKSRRRSFSRDYNEFYASNFIPMSPFVYNTENAPVGNPVEFLNRRTISKNETRYRNGIHLSVYERTKFLREYALKNDMPFTVLGD